MNMLFDNLESLIDAPNGIKKARELILQFAFEGKLVEQDSKFESATALFDKIKKIKEGLIVEKKIKRENPLPLIESDNIPHKIPRNWIWVRLGDICSHITDIDHKMPKAVSKGVKFLSAKDLLDNGTINLSDSVKHISEEDFKYYSKRIIPQRSDIIFSRIGTIGKARIVNTDERFLVSYSCCTIRPIQINVNFLNYFLDSGIVLKQAAKETQSIGVPDLGIKKIKEFLIPLPSLNEQKRIVEKVNSLMALLDELEEKRERRNQKRIKLNNASLDKLLISKDDKELNTNWKLIEENFSTLYSVPENVEKLKQAILQLAVQGKLVEQDPKDEPASELLKNIKKEKDQLIAERKIKKQKEIPPIKEEEKPFELPKGWEWVRLGEATNYGINLKSEGNKLNDQTWVLELEDIEKITSRVLQKVRFKDKKFKSTKNFFKAGDVIYGKLRPYLDKVIVADEDGVCTTEMIPVRGYCDIDPYYLRLVLKSPYFAEYATNSTHGMNLPRLGTDKARTALFPITSLNEQKRIVEKVNELLSLCNALEEKLTKKEATAERLVGALVNAVANKTTKPKDDKESVIKELISKHKKALEKLS